MKLGKFDSLFLFLTSIFSLLFGLFQYFFGAVTGLKGVIAFILLLVVGAGMPIYIGFYRGGIKSGNIHNSVVERARGCIYGLVGAGTYLAYSLHGILFWSDRFAAIALYFLVALVAAAAGGFGACRVLPLLEEKLSERDTRVLSHTGIASVFSATLLANLFLIFVEIFDAEGHFVGARTGYDSLVPIYVMLLSSSLGVGLWSEYDARKEMLSKELLNGKEG